jgi:hypothetical protein
MADDAVLRFRDRAERWCSPFFQQHASEVQMAEDYIRRRVREACRMQWTARRSDLIVTLVGQITSIVDDLTAESSRAVSDEIRRLSSLRLSTSSNIGVEHFLPITRPILKKLSSLIEAIRPDYREIIPDEPEQARAKISRQSDDLIAAFLNKRRRPRSLTELMEVAKIHNDDIVWLYPGNFAGLQFRVSSTLRDDPRLELLQPSGLSIFTPNVRIQGDGDNTSIEILWGWLHGITYWSRDIGPFYINGDSMVIVFGTGVKVGKNEALVIDLPPGITIQNIDGYGEYRLRRFGSQWLALLLEPGSYPRGPRLISDHA